MVLMTLSIRPDSTCLAMLSVKPFANRENDSCKNYTRSSVLR